MEKRRFYIIFFALALLFAPMTVFAGDGSAETIRVGYYENEVFEEGASPDAVKTGYAYEYYCKLSEYTGWKYEYVYGSFSDLYDMLLSGEIDLLAGLAKRDDRTGIIGYPAEPMGNEIYTLVKHDFDTDITVSPASMEGRRIGVLKSAVCDTLKEYLSAQSITAEVITFDDYESLFTAFDSKEVDILAAEGDGAYGRDHAEVICTFGTSNYYLCVAKNRPDLLQELDEAQSHLILDDPNYIGDLRSRYYSSSVSSHSFSESEREWIENNRQLRVGYLNNYLPYSSTDKDGNVTGIVKDIIPEMLQDLSLTHISVSYKGFDNYDDMIAAIASDEIDVGFPVGGGLYYSEENGIYQSSSVVSASTDLVYEGEYDQTETSSFAVNANNRMQYYYVKTHFPEAKITFYQDIDACLKAVLKGDVEATTLNGLRATEILKNRKYKRLFLHQLSQNDDRCFGVKIGNEGLIRLLNHGIKILGPEYAREMSDKYSGELYSYTAFDVILDNMWLFLTMSLLIALVIIALIVRDLNRTRLADRMKSDFVSNMSHEIRTPITAILGMNEMIQRETEDPVIETYSENIRKAGVSLLGIISDILDFSKIETGKMTLEHEEYSLKSMVTDLYNLVQFRAEAKGLELIFKVDPELPSVPVGDEIRLKQVITNLLTNAIKYTEQGSVIFEIKMDEKNGDSVRFTVSVTDTGIGIRAEDMKRLFEPFDRLDLKKNRTIEGTGLGLAITRQLLSIMDSELKVESRYEQGSCFSFTLTEKVSDFSPVGQFDPHEHFEHQNVGVRKHSLFTAPGAKLLVVDDTPMNLQVITGLLKRTGMQIDVASGGEECIEKFGSTHYDLVFLDYRMPKMNGIETLAVIREKYPEKYEQTPIISLTASAVFGDKEKMLDAGFKDYLSKPVNIDEMERMMIKYLPSDLLILLHEDGENKEDDELSKLPEAFRDHPELDPAKGIEYCGDAEEYMFAIETFANSLDAKAEQIEEDLKNEDYETLALNVHSLKSTSGAIGAAHLSENAKAIELAAKSQDLDTVKADTPALLAEYRALKNVLHELLENYDPDA